MKYDNPWLTYIMSAQGTDRVKIGKTTDLPTRLKDLQTGCPYQLVVLCVLPGKRERELHSLFSSSRVRGEWFTKSEKISDFILAHT